MPNTLFKVTFLNVGPIRMISDYNDSASAEVRGPVNLDFPDGLQDIFAEDSIHKFLYLVDWVTENNLPGFIVLKVDPKIDKIYSSERVMGCCHKIEVTEGGVLVTSFQASQFPNSVRYPIIEIKSFPHEYKKFVNVNPRFRT